MKPASFEYLRPGTVDEAIAALDHEDAKIIAGGQSLVPMMNFRLVQPERLVDINGIADLGQVTAVDGGVRIGALVRHAQAARDTMLGTAFPIIGEAMRHVAHVAIRNRGTIGGSLSHADPSAEWPLLVSLLDGAIEITGKSGVRTCGTEEFFFSPLMTDLEEDELLTGVVLPSLPDGAGMAFDEVSQRAGDFAVVACGAVVAMDGPCIGSARLALGGLGDTPLRATEVEVALTGATLDDIAGIVADCAVDLEPNDDMHASAGYRRSLAPVLARRVLIRAAERAKGKT
ncbi:carbon-monoxide dehydrogenase medium subunit [Roseovarius pacificus]|uniref:Carbon-monoxide dehydrogenase medium subunit n=1 Tax=Roseovarius pacificus TaxID=337701 RepID=A0A1M7JDG8_9RHOB|nr:xanthine dehydrogenase family protein subunit M [Roseovarius pacificus]GGO61920.1 carbon monoxide dehydrogenase [Roseovarius pacificus]SHM51042.1 carbon-monoxide dehydrogenase medium subunit [Roseovarius pacificus]